MKKSLLEIYALAICFIAMITLMFNIGFAIYSSISIFAPAFTFSTYQQEKYMTNAGYCKEFASECSNKNEAEMTKSREAAYQAALLNEKHSAQQNLVLEGIILLVSFIIFSIHWRIARKARLNS